MTQLDDLDDDCLSQVLDRLPVDQLFKMLGVNKRMKRLADKLMGTKVKAIAFNGESRDFTDCRSHLGGIRQDQVLFLEPLLKNKSVEESSKLAFFSSLLSKCQAVKCLDTFSSFPFLSKPMPDGLFMEVVRRCPELECLKLSQFAVRENDFERTLELIGHRIVHLVKYKPQFHFSAPAFNSPMPPPKTGVQLLETVIKKCPNIKRIDWAMTNGRLTSLVMALKMLPDDCWIALDTDGAFETNDIEDVVDELIITWNLPHFNSRANRLSSLTWKYYDCMQQLVRGVYFAGLKKLDVSGCRRYDNYIVGCLVASRFPQLEELRFSPNIGLTEANFDAIFQRMKSVKKLIISWYFYTQIFPLLPGPAINHLKQLETIESDILTYSNNWKPDIFLQQLEHYVDKIRTLKKLVVYVHDRGFDGWKELVEEKVEGMKKKQNRVEVDFIYQKWESGNRVADSSSQIIPVPL